jgi:hypothetical protein
MPDQHMSIQYNTPITRHNFQMNTKQPAYKHCIALITELQAQEINAEPTTTSTQRAARE